MQNGSGWIWVGGMLLFLLAFMGCESGTQSEPSRHTLIRKHYPKSLQVKEEYFVLDSTIRDSLYQSWHLNGAKKDSGYYRMGKRDGLWYEFSDHAATREDWKWLTTFIHTHRNDTLFKSDQWDIVTDTSTYGPRNLIGRTINFYHSDTLMLDSVWNEDGSLNTNKMKFADDRMDSIITYESPGKYFYKDVLYHGKLLMTIHYYPKYWVEIHNNPSPEMRKKMGPLAK
jgi:hypothetical protein